MALTLATQQGKNLSQTPPLPGTPTTSAGLTANHRAVGWSTCHRTRAVRNGSPAVHRSPGGRCDPREIKPGWRTVIRMKSKVRGPRTGGRAIGSRDQFSGRAQVDASLRQDCAAAPQIAWDWVTPTSGRASLSCRRVGPGRCADPTARVPRRTEPSHPGRPDPRRPGCLFGIP
jgi:hypothetical protein